MVCVFPRLSRRSRPTFGRPVPEDVDLARVEQGLDERRILGVEREWGVVVA